MSKVVQLLDQRWKSPEVIFILVSDGNEFNVVFPDALETVDETHNPVGDIVGSTEQAPLHLQSILVQECYQRHRGRWAANL